MDSKRKVPLKKIVRLIFIVLFLLCTICGLLMLVLPEPSTEEEGVKPLSVTGWILLAVGVQGSFVIGVAIFCTNSSSNNADPDTSYALDATSGVPEATTEPNPNSNSANSSARSTQSGHINHIVLSMYSPQSGRNLEGGDLNGHGMDPTPSITLPPYSPPSEVFLQPPPPYNLHKDISDSTTCSDQNNNQAQLEIAVTAPQNPCQDEPPPSYAESVTLSMGRCPL